MAFINFFESDADEIARLNRSWVGSGSRTLAGLPVTNPHPDRGQVLELPPMHNGRRIIVVPTEFRTGPASGADWYNTPDDEHPLRRYDGAWSCLVVASDDPVYTSCANGGYDIIVSESELRRGRLIDLLAAPAKTPGE